MVRPPSAGRIDPSIEFDPDLTQPYVDEYIVGFSKTVSRDCSPWTQLSSTVVTPRPMPFSTSTGSIPTGRTNPFVGFGLIDPNMGIIYQQTNNSWSKLNYTALEITVTKRLSRKLSSHSRDSTSQWHHISGTWNPGDPARFIQPDHFANNKADVHAPWQQRAEQPSARQRNLSYAPTWR